MKFFYSLITRSPSRLFRLSSFIALLFGFFLPVAAQTTIDHYKNHVDQSIIALDSSDTRAAYQAFSKARKAARKENDQTKQDAFRDCLKKIPFYEIYLPLVETANIKLKEEDYKNAQLSLMMAKEQLDLSMEITVDVPAFSQYEADRRQALEERIQLIEAQRLPLIEQALAKGDDKMLLNLPGEALDDFYFARSLTLDQTDENRRYRIGELIRKAELHYDIYTQLNLGRREAGYKNYREAQKIYQEALAKIDQSRTYYFPRLETLDLQKLQEIHGLINEVNDKRVKIYELAIHQGLDLLEKDQPEEAIKSLSYAKQQMIEEREYQTSGVDQLLDQAQYTILIRKGDELLGKSDYASAINIYQEAQNKVKSSEVSLKIQQATENGYQQAIIRGREAFSQGNYEEAHQHYQTAASFSNGVELKNLLYRHYEELILLGQQEKERAAYAQAKEYFENARMFYDTPEIQELVDEVQGVADYASAYAAGERYLRTGQIAAAKESFEQARTFQNKVEVQNHLFKIEDYLLAIRDGQRSLEENDSELAKAYFQNAKDIYNTPEVNEWLRKTGVQVNRDRSSVQSYDTQSVMTARSPLTIKGVGTGRIDFNFNTVMWMRPDCNLPWMVELYNSFGTLTATAKIDNLCRFTISNLSNGTYTYVIKLQENSGKTTTYRTDDNEIVIQNGETVAIEINAKGKQ